MLFNIPVKIRDFEVCQLSFEAEHYEEMSPFYLRFTSDNEAWEQVKYIFSHFVDEQGRHLYGFNPRKGLDSPYGLISLRCLLLNLFLPLPSSLLREGDFVFDFSHVGDLPPSFYSVSSQDFPLDII